MINYSTDHSQRQISPDQDDSFEIVQSNHKKKFMTPQSKNQPKNRKNELCKNFEQKGYCKFKDQCAFAHGQAQLTKDVSTMMYRRNKPCRRFFDAGCQYGNNCHNLHYEAINDENHREFIERVYREQKLMVPLHPNKLIEGNRPDLQRFQHLYKIFGRKLEFKRDDLIVNVCRPRSEYFKNKFPLGDTKQNFEKIVMSSRKISEALSH
ncbi:hypothetical protein pb186bvf_017768 [Paramecium bursaria]